MTALVLLLVGAATLYGAWSWIRWTVAHRRYLQERDGFEDRIRGLLARASTEAAFRPASSDEEDLVAYLRSAASEIEALETIGFTLVGDLVADDGNPDSTSLVRVWADAKGTTQAQIHVSRLAPSQWCLAILSITEDMELVTLRGEAQSELSRPPWSRRQVVPPRTPVDRLVACHDAFVIDHSAHFVSITSIEQIADLARRNEARLMSWRATQPPDVLLEADLRDLLGEDYDRDGGYWARRLRASVPKATLRR